jgi:hypothetical protein
MASKSADAPEVSPHPLSIVVLKSGKSNERPDFAGYP